MLSFPRRIFFGPWRRFFLLVLLLDLRTQAATADPTKEEAAWAAFSQASAPEATERYVSSGHELQQLDIYLPSTRATRSTKGQPVLILVHGGGWSGETRELFAPHARYFAALGWTTLNISYRLTSIPGVTLMNAQEDVRAAFDWARTQAKQRGWDANHIVVLGESAGGQLACALGILPPQPERWRPHSLILVNPVLDLTTLPWALTQPGVREGGAFDPAAAAAAQHPAYLVSPLFHVKTDSPPTLLVHGTADTVVPFAQAEAYAARAKSARAHVELVALENTGHAFFLTRYGTPPVIRATLQRIGQFLGEP